MTTRTNVSPTRDARLSTSLSTLSPPPHPQWVYSIASHSAYSWLVMVLALSWKANRFPA